MENYDAEVQKKFKELGFYYDSHGVWVYWNNKPFRRLLASDIYQDEDERYKVAPTKPFIQFWMELNHGFRGVNYVSPEYKENARLWRTDSVEFMFTLGFRNFIKLTKDDVERMVEFINSYNFNLTEKK